MTFINRRIIKRPTLFATSRRNFGNLLTHYETGQDRTTPDPDPTPDPVAFTTSWSTNGGIVEANLTGISSHRTTEVIVLTRDDGTVLATLDENKVGDWDLQRDEGTTYGSYTYNVRLDGVIKSTFSRDYQHNVPSFSTNFFSNIAKRISCGVENISNPPRQLFESDYGTYDYKLLLSKWTTTSTSNPNIPPESYWVDTVIATHQQIFVRPEPTFTTSWTKSGLTINADLSSITGAHPEFYAYLTRDDGTTLATHEFQTGQTTTSLTFTETEYGSYNYQLKLGTVVKSSHTETYVRPTPTYTASFSTNELTLTVGITSITNAHNSFAITLERDDGTVLQTHTLADGETSFNFTQTESLYATFNYVVKINGTQTDTYSATYTPPPTPTFDIALTSDDLAITATLTNIVNPDPYYTLMIHDANDTHLDGHTFATGDTTVVLTWTETSYGEKTYTKLLNGASIGTETITLTDPNASTPTINHNTLITIPSVINSSVSSHTWTFVPGESGQSAGQTYDGSSKLVYSFVSTNRTIKFQAGTWADESTTQAPNQVLYNSANGFVELGDMYAGDQDFGAFTSPFFSSASSTPIIPNKIDVSPVIHAGHDFYYLSGGSGVGSSYVEGDVLVYAYRAENEQAYSRTIQYQSGVWSDLNSSENPTDVATNNNSQNISITLGDIYSTGFVNPFYEAPTPPTVVSPLPALSQHTQAFNMEYYQTVGTKYYYKSDSHSGTGTSITYDYETKTWNDEGSQVPYHLNTTSTFASTTSLVNPAEIHAFGSQQNHNGTRYFSVSNPYYEAPPSYFLSSPRAIGDWINCADNPFTWNGTTYTLQRTGGSMKYTSDDGTSAIWTYCNSTGGNSQSGDSVKRLSSGGWEDGPGSRPNGNNSINEHNNVLFISHPNTPVEAVWGFDDPYDVSP
ncbi:unnamed protein product [Bathycoccus prasinos]